jgi:hypothetical protein
MIDKQQVRRKYRKSKTIVRPCADLGEKMERCMSRLEHDLRGCMQVITGYADLIVEEANGRMEPEQLRRLAFIKCGSKEVQVAIERGQARVRELVHPESKRK